MSRSAAVSLLIVLSGFAGLVYQVVWAKHLTLSLGGAAAAHTAVLALFLGGLAGGNALFGPLADRTRSPLAVYALLEIGIGIWGILSPGMLRLVSGPLGAALVLLPPTLLMGGTLPLLTRWRVHALDGLRAGLGRLYALNSAGAATGALAAGFFLIPVYGLDAPLYAAGLLNCAIAAAAWALNRSVAPSAVSLARGENPDRLVLLAVFFAGAATLIYEIAWIRILSLSLGASAYSFSLMLAAFITGITLGSLWAATALSKLDPRSGFALTQLGAVAAAALGAAFCERLPYYSLLLQSALDRSHANFMLFSGLRFGLCVAALLPLTFFIGAQLPWAVRAATRSSGGIGAGVGAVFSWNTLGNVAGASLAGLWLLPALGLRGTLLLAMGLNAFAGALLGRGPAPWLPAAALAIAAVAGPRLDLAALTSGTYRLRAPKGLTFAEFRAEHASRKQLFYRDDREGTVTVEEDADGVRVLKINGKTDASTGSDMPTQELLAALPLALHPTAKRALIIGLGSGVTAGTALKHPLERLDVVELSASVTEAERFFRSVNGDPLSDARLSLYIQDAQKFLREAGPSYDAIISEPSNPWIAGIGNLFTVEFYARAKSRLAPGGVFVQWFHLYEMSDEVLQLVLRTFAQAFPNVSLWEVGSNDILILGSMTDIAVPAAEGLAPLLSLQSMSDRALRAAAGEGPLNFDYRPRLEYEAPRALFLDEESGLLRGFDERLDARKASQLLLPRYMRGRPLSEETLAAMLGLHGDFGGPVYDRLAAEWRRRYPGKRTP